MKRIFIFLTITLALASCVSESEHQRVIDEKNALSTENQNLKNELEEIKFGAPNLLSDGKKFYQAKEFSQAKEKFQTLLQKHPDMPQSIEAKKYLANIDEEELWQNALNSEEVGATENYIENYPQGKYISNAILRKDKLKELNMQKAYDNAIISNSSFTWKRFLEDYPDHPDYSSIKEKIIRLEVDEILGDRETGRIPSFDNYSTSYSSNSSVEITNNTGCNLTVRYSGVEAKMIEIPSGGTRTVFLSSGTYKIAASACGANYAGTESLHGSYGSTFYISRTRF
ncbi:MAG: hypothetical protein HS118_09660 [Bacteroidia bacterium]|nr:hypothetical protein [Bacteroidia bacterium]